MQLARLRSRIFLALGLGTALGSGGAGCGTSTAHPDAAAQADAAAQVDGSTHDATASDAPPRDAPTDGPISIRRPFLVGASLRSSAAAARSDWAGLHERGEAALHDRREAALLDAKTRAALARAWRQDALEEHASIAAFARFALHLLSVGAPPELVAAAHRAGADEVRHARAAFALAERYGERAIGPAPLRIDDALGPQSLAEIAELTAEEGCVGETLGALLAGRQAELATDPIVRRVMRGLARDELRHAELAWQFVRWAVATGGAAVLAAVTRGIRRAAAATLAAPVRGYDVDLAAWHSHGRVTCEEARELAALGIAQLVEPALAGLRAGLADMTLSRDRGKLSA